MTRINKACYERGCACYDDRVDDDAVEVILAQPEQEPVAVKHMKAWVAYLKRKSDHGQHMQIPSEMSAGACWELAIELEQFINTTPPQRTWVGLTEQDLDYLCNLAYTGDEEFALAVQAKLMEKNA